MSGTQDVTCHVTLAAAQEQIKRVFLEEKRQPQRS